MKTERRHELQTNELADWIGVWLEKSQQYSKAIGASIVAVAVIIGVGFYLWNRSANQQAALWDQYYQAAGSNGGIDALENLADTYPKTAPGNWARLTLAEFELVRGETEIFDDRTKGRDMLGKAVNNYKLAYDSGRGEGVAERAALGLGRAYESLDKLPDAREQYEKVVSRWPKTVFADEARARLDDLARQPTKAFYDWFDKQEAKPTTSGIPGLRPEFNPHTLPPDAVDLKLNSSFGAKTENKADEKPAAEEKPAASEKSEKPTSETKPAEKAAATKPAEEKPAEKKPAESSETKSPKSDSK